MSSDSSPSSSSSASDSNSDSSEVSFAVALLSGGCAGTSVDVVLYPIDTLKTRLQSAQGFRAAGGFKGIYKGLSAAAAGSAPGAALFFVTYEKVKPLMHRGFNSLKMESIQYDSVNSNPLAHMAAAGAGETSACLVRVPTEIVKQRMQTGQYATFASAVSSIWGKQGFFGFYVGYGTTVLREIPFAFIQFPLWERLKLIWANKIYGGDSNQVKPWQGALCGSIAGGFAAAVTTPLDVIKTRLMLGSDAQGVAYNGFADCSRRIMRDEGAAAFLKGIEPRVMWIFIGGFVFFGAYEKARNVLTPMVDGRD